MKLLSTLCVLMMCSSAFAKTEFICNINPAQSGLGKPDTIVANFIENRSKGQIHGTVSLKFENHKLREVAGVKLGTPDENQISADFTLSASNGQSVSLEILFYADGKPTASLYNVDSAGNKVGSSLDYQCGRLEGAP